MPKEVYVSDLREGARLKGERFLLLHRLDWMDGEAGAVIDHLRQDPANGNRWTSRCPMVWREIYRPVEQHLV